MELRQLRYMVGVCEAGSLLAASRTLHVAQPALSQHIAALEYELEARLFTRTSRGMTMTEAGRAFLDHARVVLADVERAKAAIRPTEAELHGEVVLGLSSSVALIATLPVLLAMRRAHPGVHLRFVEGHGSYLADWLRDGRLDAALLYGGSSSPLFDQHPLLQEPFALVTAASGKPAPAEISLRRVAGRRLVLPARDHALRRLLEDACAQARIELNVIAEIDSLHTIKAAVEQGIADSVLSPGSISQEVASGRLSASLIRSPKITRKLFVAVSFTRPQTPATRALVVIVEDTVRHLVDAGTWPAAWIADPAAAAAAATELPSKPGANGVSSASTMSCDVRDAPPRPTRPARPAPSPTRPTRPARPR